MGSASGNLTACWLENPRHDALAVGCVLPSYRRFSRAESCTAMRSRSREPSLRRRSPGLRRPLIPHCKAVLHE